MPVPVSRKSRRTGYESARGKRTTSHPVLHETKEKGKLKRLLKKLIHIRKGH